MVKKSYFARVSSTVTYRLRICARKLMLHHVNVLFLNNRFYNHSVKLYDGSATIQLQLQLMDLLSYKLLMSISVHPSI